MQHQHADSGTDPIRTYRSYVGSKDLDGEGWVYVVSPRAVLDDAFTTLSTKRHLESGAVSPEDVPAGVVVARVAIADAATTDMALACASGAVPEWAARPLSVRVDEFMSRMHRTFATHADEIVDVLTTEGHPVDLARWQVSGILESTGPRGRDFYRSQLEVSNVRDERGRQLIVRRQPDGVVCVDPPANAALSSAVLAMGAIIAGNAVVIRAPRSGPYGVMYAMRELIAPILDDLEAPAGVLNVLCGPPAPVLDAWLSSPHVNDIMYFGGSQAGLEFEARCVKARKKPILELAGNDVVVVWRDADVDCAAEALTESFQGSGQLCMIPNQALVHPAIAEELIARLVEHTQRFVPGYPEDEATLLSPVLRRDNYFAYMHDALDKGAQLITGGKPVQMDGCEDATGLFLQPTVLRIDGLDRARELDAVRHETFFPLLPIVVADDADDAMLLDEFVAYVNANPYGLRNSVWASDTAVIDRFVNGVRNGGLLKINDSHFGHVAGLPTHGGTGLTGGVFGEANVPVIRTTHLQGVAISPAPRRPRESALAEWTRLKSTELALQTGAAR